MPTFSGKLFSGTWVLICLFLALLPVKAVAHGGGTPQLTDADAGPYRLFAWTEPEPWRVGEVHLSVMVTLAPEAGALTDQRSAANRLDEPVNDADVLVTFTALDGGGEGHTAAAEVQALGSNISYEVDTTLPDEGGWRIAILVEGPEGTGQASFDTEVLARQRINIWLLAGAVLLLIGAIALIGARRRVAAG